MAYYYTCYLCQEEFEVNEALPETNNDEVFLCKTCGDSVHCLLFDVVEEIEVDLDG